MGAQQTKERIVPVGSAARQTRKQPRNLKESRLVGSNIFTEHSGNSFSYISLLTLAFYLLFLSYFRSFFSFLSLALSSSVSFRFSLAFTHFEQS